MAGTILSQIVVKLVCLCLAAGGSVCPDGWFHRNKSCYHVNQESTTWTEAQKMCELHDSHLVYIESAQEQSVLETLLHHVYGYDVNADYWAGASDWNIEGKWVWEPNLQPLSYTNWFPGQPNNGRYSGHNIHQPGFDDQNCLLLRYNHSFQWIDTECSGRHFYVCEIPAAHIHRSPTQAVMTSTKIPNSLPPTNSNSLALSTSVTLKIAESMNNSTSKTPTKTMFTNAQNSKISTKATQTKMPTPHTPVTTASTKIPIFQTPTNKPSTESSISQRPTNTQGNKTLSLTNVFSKSTKPIFVTTTPIIKNATKTSTAFGKSKESTVGTNIVTQTMMKATTHSITTNDIITKTTRVNPTLSTIIFKLKTTTVITNMPTSAQKTSRQTNTLTTTAIKTGITDMPTPVQKTTRRPNTLTTAAITAKPSSAQKTTTEEEVVLIG